MTTLSEKETSRLKKQWLFSGLVLAIMGPILLSYSVIFTRGAVRSLRGWILFFVAFNLALLFLNWAFAYRKTGTKVLTAYLAVLLITFFNNLLEFAGINGFLEKTFDNSSYNYAAFHVSSPLSIISSIGYILLSALFIYFSFKLRSANKFFNLINQNNFDTTIFAKAFERVKSLDELNQKYRDLTLEYPNFEVLITNQYQLFKTRFEKN